LVASACGCDRILRSSLEKNYQDARQKFEHGDLAGASAEADNGYRHSQGSLEWAWRFRVLEAEVFVWRGLSKDSLGLLDQPVPSELADGDIAVRKELIESFADGVQRRFDEASRHSAQAQQIAEGHEPILLDEVYLGRGTLAVMQGDTPGARSAFRRSLELARQDKQYFLETRALGSLGLVSMNEGHFDESIDWYTRSLEMSRSLGARIVTEKTLGNMGWSYYQMGDLDMAFALSSEARVAAQQLNVNADEPLWLRNMGLIEEVRRSYSAAAQDYLQALSLTNRIENKTLAGECLHNLAIVELKSGRYEQAEGHVREALALERASNDRPMELYSITTEGYIAAAKGDYVRAEADLREVMRDKDSDSSLQWQSELGIAKVFAEEKRWAKADQYFKKGMATIETARSSIQREEFRLTFMSRTIEYYEAYISYLNSRRKVEEAMNVAELSRAQTLAEGLGFRSTLTSLPIESFHPRQIAKRLNATILSYWLGVDHSYLWVITPARLELFTLPPATEIDPLVQAYRQALLGSRDVLETQNAAGRKLYDLLVAPAAKMIPKGARVTILPDGSLYGLNFETLLAPSPQLHYWIEDVDVSYANSLTLLAAGVARHTSHAKKLLLVGDPVSPDAEFPRLPQAAAEMTGIENYFPAAERTVFSGAEATPDSYLKSQPADFSYIHFVAHGTASRISPLDSAVILSKQGDGYKLYARDIIQHPLHADLVTISACHGEGVRTYSGEGLVGLSWAFLRAGAHGVIAALWEVNDNSTPQLMDHLYSEIGKGAPPDAALRDAKLALLHSGGVYRRPFYWAPFELYRGS
jgi:CHAT domain-containing protein